MDGSTTKTVKQSKNKAREVVSQHILTKKGRSNCLPCVTGRAWLCIGRLFCYSTTCEQKYSINELKLLRVVWSLGHIRTYSNSKKMFRNYES